MSNIEKVNINMKCCIFTLAYSWVHNRRGGGRGVEINGGKGGRGLENLIAGVGLRRFNLIR